MSKRLLITGHTGFIGSCLTPLALDHGYDVVGLDTGYFRDCTMGDCNSSVTEIHKDIRDITLADLEGIDAVIHLAALSNDPLGNINSTWTESINYEAAVSLAALAKQAGVRRFLFSSSCIMYGVSEAARVNEESPLDPQTVYAESKVHSEREISKMANDHFSPTFLRNGTIYGYSSRIRLDTVLNNLTASGFTTGKVVLYSDGSPWRPVIHVEDVVQAFLLILEAPIEVVHNQAFNIGAESCNSQIRDLANAVAEQLPSCEVIYSSKPGADQRTYITDFSKIGREIPDFQLRWNVEEGVDSLIRTFQNHSLSYNQFSGRKFIRLSWLEHLLNQDCLDSQLRWRKKQVF